MIYHIPTIYDGTNNNTIIPTRTPTIKLKHIITEYSKIITTEPPTKPTKISMEITMIPTLE